jgi:glycerophosphoryl diester phosphodiesterase
MRQTQPLLIAHRTCPRHAPENSLAGIRRAEELGADLVEVDVRGTRERERVLVHDRTTRRTAGGPWIVSRTSLARIRTLRLKHAGEHAAEPPPLLWEALQALGTRMGIAIEVKDARVVSGVLSDVRDAGATDRTLLWSYSERVVRWLAGQAREVEVSLLRDTRNARQDRKLLDDAVALGARGVSLRWTAIDASFAAEARRLGLSLYAMCDGPRPDPQTARLLTGVITDWPAEARAALRQDTTIAP